MEPLSHLLDRAEVAEVTAPFCVSVSNQQEAIRKL